MTSRAVVHTDDLPPVGMVRDPATGGLIPRGEDLMAAALERMPDVEAQLVAWKRNRDAVIRFTRDYLTESEYDTKGYPVPGKVGDYYKVPGAPTKALTKRGGEKVAQLLRFAKGETKVVNMTETAEYVSATVEVTLTDQYRRPVGSAVSSCSTAEPGFRSPSARKKYGARSKKERDEWIETAPPDYRAAVNDIVARAGKRAFVQAVIVAGALDEIFTAAEDAEEAPAPPAPKSTRGDLPTHLPFKRDRRAIAELNELELAGVIEWCQEKGKFADLIEACQLEQERRRTDDAEPGV
jgi:hypothetical protein